VRFTLTAGQRGDAPQAAALIAGLPAEVVMADTAYDAALPEAERMPLRLEGTDGKFYFRRVPPARCRVGAV